MERPGDRNSEQGARNSPFGLSEDKLRKASLATAEWGSTHQGMFLLQEEFAG